ncbi:MAG: DUF362 domain-containing protein [Deltaproteobacteria bacterium]|nr:MAG: DUF362 domain-containing protein [Deltaproteobacteria bacterium]
MDRKINPTTARVLIFDAAYDESMEQVIARILDDLPLSWEGKKVLVKPNILGPCAPEEGVTTHPFLVRAVVRQLRQRGGKVIVGDNPGVQGYGDSENAGRTCGLVDAAEGCFVNLGHNPVRYQVSSRYLDSVMIAGDVLDADIVVNLPKLKTHGLTNITAAVKNTFGYVVGGDKMRIHSQANTPRRFAEALVDIYQIRPPELNILDAVVAMEGNGPHHGSLRTLGKVLASENAVSLDAVAIHLIGQEVKSVPHVQIAGGRGLGEVDLSRISLNGKLIPVTDFKLPTTFIPGLTGVVLNRFLSRWINCIPEIIKESCRACGICVKHCPGEAMQMETGPPQIDRDKCINCYCCQEMCPEGAIRLSGRTINVLRSIYSPR